MQKWEREVECGGKTECKQVNKEEENSGYLFVLLIVLGLVSGEK